LVFKHGFDARIDHWWAQVSQHAAQVGEIVTASLYGITMPDSFQRPAKEHMLARKTNDERIE